MVTNPLGLDASVDINAAIPTKGVYTAFLSSWSIAPETLHNPYQTLHGVLPEDDWQIQGYSQQFSPHLSFPQYWPMVRSVEIGKGSSSLGCPSLKFWNCHGDPSYQCHCCALSLYPPIIANKLDLVRLLKNLFVSWSGTEASSPCSYSWQYFLASPLLEDPSNTL